MYDQQSSIEIIDPLSYKSSWHWIKLFLNYIGRYLGYLQPWT